MNALVTVIRKGLQCARMTVLMVVLIACAQATPIIADGLQTVHGVNKDAGSVVTVRAVNLSNQRLQQVPITFGQPFHAGDIPVGDSVVAYLNGKALPTQANIKARNPDGSVRHAIMTVLLPTLGSRASEDLNLRSIPDAATPKADTLTIKDILQTKFDAAINFTIAGEPWHLDAKALLQRALQDGSCKPYGRECNQWLSGPLVSEWVVGGPLLDEQGKPNAHLAVYFAVRAFGLVPIQRVRVDVIVENDWAYQPEPHNVTYNATIMVGGQVLDTINNLEHYRQARWHKAFWWGTPDPVYAELNSRYLQYSRAVPRYEIVQPTESLLRKVIQSCPPMQRCDQTKDMSNVGEQAAIGPLARWSSVYVVDPTYRAYRWMLANSDALGAYGIHYRDQLTGQPVSIEQHPCMTTNRQAELAKCQIPPHKNDNFPRCKDQCKSPLSPNEAHHPSPAYVAYLVTGDWYYLEELKFWADWVVFQQNPAYRDYRKGLIVYTALRGQAWALRTLGYAAYILPENDPFKSYFNQVVENNIQWYNQKYTDNPHVNALHIITNGYALNYPNHGHKQTGIATWQISFFTWSVGNLVDLGFPGAGGLRNWVSAFQINQMTSPDFCWIVASAYQLQVRDTQDSPFYDSLHEVYVNTFPELKNIACNSNEMAASLSHPHSYRYSKSVMVGYPYSPTGYVANFQIGLAAAADSDLPEARKAWEIFAHREVKIKYADSPQFSVVPRHQLD